MTAKQAEDRYDAVMAECRANPTEDNLRRVDYARAAISTERFREWALNAHSAQPLRDALAPAVRAEATGGH